MRHLLLRFTVGTCLALAAALFADSATPAHAETGQKALILNSTVSGGAGSAEAQRANANGFSVTLVSDATWASMTAAQFADYQLIVVGDPTCSLVPRVVGQNATALADAVMARVGGNPIVGNRMLIGTDPKYHHGAGGGRLIETGIDFVGSLDGATNLYLSLSCYDNDWDGDGKPDVEARLLPKLTGDPSPGWTQNQSPPCSGQASLIANVAQFATLTSANLQNWYCSAHETFPTYPTDWVPLAIATDSPTKPTCGRDIDTGETVCGEASILIAGVGISVFAPNLALDPPAEQHAAGTPQTVTATVTDPDDVPLGGVLVSFVVTGANAGAPGSCAPGNCITDSSGTVSFTYTGLGEGDDIIFASILVEGATQTATAQKTWLRALEANLSITKSVDDATPYAGEEVTYTLVATNNGPDAVSGVTMSDSVMSSAPGSFSLLSVSGTHGTCGDLGSALACDGFSLAVGEDATMTVVLRAEKVGPATNVAAVDNDEADDVTDPNPDDNSASLTIEVRCRPVTIDAQEILVTVAPGTTYANSKPEAIVHDTLTNEPIGSHLVTFHDKDGAEKCQAYTDATGRASCDATEVMPPLVTALSLSYTARTAEAGWHCAAEDEGDLFVVSGVRSPRI